MITQVKEHLSDNELFRLEEQILSDGLLKFAQTPKRTFSIRRKLKTALWDILTKATSIRGTTENTIDIRTKRIQCSRSHHRRSQGDLFRIMKYYYPDTTFKQFRSVLFELLNEGKLQATYCPTINKRVFILVPPYRQQAYRQYGITNTFIHDSDTVDELGLTLSTWLIRNNIQKTL